VLAARFAVPNCEVIVKIVVKIQGYQGRIKRKMIIVIKFLGGLGNITAFLVFTASAASRTIRLSLRRRVRMPLFIVDERHRNDQERGHSSEFLRGAGDGATSRAVFPEVDARVC